MKLYHSLSGCRKISVAEKDSAQFLNICMKYRYAYRDMTVDSENERVSFIFTFHTSRRVMRKCREYGVGFEAGELRGLPSIIYKYRSRVGLWLGLLIAILTVYSSTRLVWDIRVSGNERLTENEVIEVLSYCGFRRGCEIEGFNADLTEARAILLCDELAWISVNLKGTVAYVEVREKLPVDDGEKPKQPANIVASYGGRIEEIIAYSGVPAVKAGDEVNAGDILISGVYGDKAPGLTVTRAAGYVKARTVRRISVEIPLEYDEKVYTGVEKCKKYVIFFQKQIKVFINSGNLGASCDKIEEEENLSLFGASLPFCLRTEKYVEYETVKAKRTVSEAEALAKARLDEILKSEFADAEISSREISFEKEGNTVILNCDVVCVENIALTQEFEINTNKNN